MKTETVDAPAVDPAADGSAICGHCGKPLSEHFDEDQIYCFKDTNGDLWSAEPGWENIGCLVEATRPELWRELVKEWKSENGHPQNAQGLATQPAPEKPEKHK